MKKLLMLAVGALLFASPLVVFAQVSCGTSGADAATCIPTGGIPSPQTGGGLPAPQTGGGVTQSLGSNNSYSSAPAGSATVTNPLGVASICGLIKALLGAAIAIGIPIAVLFVVYAGLKFVLAQGKAEDLHAARQNMLWTVIGIAIFLGAWLLASVIANTINAVSGTTGTGQQAISCN